MSHLVVTNDEGQYSTWPNDRPLPAGWHEEGFSGDEEQCLDYIGTVWTDLRPNSLRDLASAQPTVLAADDVIVREMSADEVAALLDEEAVSPAWAPGYPLAGGRAAARNFGQRPAEERKPGFGPYHIVRLDDGLVVGDIGFHAPPADGAVEVGFSLAECARGNGYAAKALNAIVTWALSQPGVDRAVARTLETNRPSQHVLARAGFGLLAQKEEILHYERAAPSLGVSQPVSSEEDEEALTGLLIARLPDEPPHEMPFLPGTTPLRSIVRDQGRAVGYVHCGHIAGVDDPDNLHLLVVVHPDVARRGLGARLLNEGRAHAIAHGVKGLVASTAGEDEASAAWARKQGFESAGRLDICRREASAGGTAAPDSAPASSALETHVVDQADENAVAELIELAVQTFASVVKPGGGRLIATADNVRALAIGDGNGTLLMCTADGAPVGWLAVSPVQDGEAGLMAAQARPDNAGQDVLDVLVREMALWADRNGVSIAAFVDPDNERDLAKAVLSHGFEQVAHRTIWLGQTTAVGTQQVMSS